MNPAAFYDEFLSSQVKSGINDRIHGLYRRTVSLGLDTHTSVLEIGCGIGTLTYLLLQKIKKGRIEGLDISPQSVAFAQKHLLAPNLNLTTGDILQYHPGAATFDRILLFDVLEHIPLQDHQALFERIAGWMNAESLLLINLPNPGYILYDQKHNPSALQEIDQPVFLPSLATVLDQCILEIVQMETYSVWVKEDYRFFVVRKVREFKEKFLHEDRSFFQKGKVWLKRKWWKLRYPYPPRN